MVRVDSLAHEIGILRQGNLDGDVYPGPANELWRLEEQPVSGARVHALFGPLVHYTLAEYLSVILSSQIGRDDKGVHLTPIAYAGCIAPYRLGLPGGVDAWILLDVSEVEELWGPGRARPGRPPWEGGAIEFFSQSPIGLSAMQDYGKINTCGDF
ncbi:hypothetical protein NE857_08960 [Nocardiopsis exhalans]|uniref:Uncharacterized protein n=1 Tax=Nocardiopsis exhalans TaxID=163604 RepID=A0ABY5DD72_9ACTN|nr:hypothetical protein [Nocardiopsis exhalans]USY21711.1 hypothetical protein NE857_08960 [Nocardiopsis exhalans]